MNHGDSKPTLKQQEKKNMLDELESLSRMLDEDLDLDDDKPDRPVPEDIPVLKSFVDDVPVLSERFLDEDDDFVEPPVVAAPVAPAPPVHFSATASSVAPASTTPAATKAPEYREPPQLREPARAAEMPVARPASAPAPQQKTDSLDLDAARFNTIPTLEFNGRLDDSFLDNDPLEISAAVRHHRTTPDGRPDGLPEAPVLRESSAANPVPAAPRQTTPPPARPVVTESGARVPPAAQPAVQPPAARPESASAAARPASFAAPAPAPVTPAAPATPAQHTAASVTQPLTRFQSANKSENPFLPKSTLDRIRENHQQYDASAELRKLIQTNPLQKLSFDASPSSKEYQALRQKASQLVNEVIRANMPRMEAELRMKLEQEVDRMFKEIRKK